MSIKLIFTIFITLIASSLANATPGGNSYYIDSVSGNDNNDGLSPSQAWQSIAKVNETMDSTIDSGTSYCTTAGGICPGDGVYFKRGMRWRDQMDISVSGDDITGSITFGAYCANIDPNLTDCDGDERTAACCPNEPNPVLAWDMNIFGKYSGDFETLKPHDEKFNGSDYFYFAYPLNTEVLPKDSGNSVLAVTDAYKGALAARIYNSPDSTTASTPTLRRSNVAVLANTEYYLSVYAKIDLATGPDGDNIDGLRLRVKDETVGNYLQQNGNWGASSVNLEVTGLNDSWQEVSLSFKTQATTERVMLDWVANDTYTAVYIDSAHLYEMGNDVFGSLNGNMETLDSGSTDPADSDDFGSWYEANNDGTSTIDAVLDGSSTVAQLHRPNETSDSPYLRRNNVNIQPNSENTLEVLAKLAAVSANGFRVRVYDDDNNLYLQDDGSWGPYNDLFSGETLTDSSWKKLSLTFNTLSDPDGDGVLKVRFDIAATTLGTTVFVDDFQVYEGTGPNRPANSDNSGVEQQHSLLLNDQSYIVIDAIDMVGPGSLTTGNVHRILSSHVLSVGGTADHIQIQNLEVSESSDIGIRVGKTAGNVNIDNVNVHHNDNTGLYQSASIGSNSVTDSKIHSNGKDNAAGDRGGIGSYQGANITIEGNEVWNNGPDDDIGDHEISIVSATGNVVITRNYVHDCIQGCIQVADDGDSSSGFHHTISYNVIEGFATSLFEYDAELEIQPSAGQWSGIRVGPGGCARLNAAPFNCPTTDVEIYNNSITGGETPPNYVGPTAEGSESAIFISRFDNSGIKIKNNLIVDNDTNAIYFDSSQYSVHTGYEVDYNIYESGDDFYWKGNKYTDLASWKTAVSSDITTPFIFDENSFTSTLVENFWGAYIYGNLPLRHADLLDEGTNVGQTQDFYGQTTVSGETTPNIGPMETSY